MALPVVNLVQAVHVHIDAGGRGAQAPSAFEQIPFVGAAVEQAGTLVLDARLVQAAPRPHQIPDDIDHIGKERHADNERHQVERRHDVARSGQRGLLAHADSHAPVVDADRLVVHIGDASRFLRDRAHIAAPAVGYVVHRLLVAVALERLSAAQVGHAAEGIVPGIEQDIAARPVDDHYEGLAVVWLDGEGARRLLQRDHAVEHCDGLAVLYHGDGVADDQRIRREKAVDTVGNVSAACRLCLKGPQRGDVVPRPVLVQHPSVRQKKLDVGDEGPLRAAGIHDLQHRVQIVLLLQGDQVRHGRQDDLVRLDRVIIVLGRALRRGGKLVEGILLHLVARAPDKGKDHSRQKGHGDQRDREQDTVPFSIIHFRSPFAAIPADAVPSSRKKADRLLREGCSLSISANRGFGA